MHGGSCILEVQGNRLELKWICADGVIRDRFTMMKNVNQRQVISIKERRDGPVAASFNRALSLNAAGSGSKAAQKIPG